MVLFIVVRGIFPFKEARTDEYFYNMIVNGKIEQYFKKIKGTHFSEDFKDLVIKMLAYDGSDRPTIE